MQHKCVMKSPSEKKQRKKVFLTGNERQRTVVLVCRSEYIFCWNSEMCVCFFSCTFFKMIGGRQTAKRERKRNHRQKKDPFVLSHQKITFIAHILHTLIHLGLLSVRCSLRRKKVNCIVCSVLLLFIFSLCKNERAHTYRKCNKSNECDALYYHIHIHACGFNHHHPQYTNMARKPDKIQVQKILKLLPNG